MCSAYIFFLLLNFRVFCLSEVLCFDHEDMLMCMPEVMCFDYIGDNAELGWRVVVQY
ncbi:hypothetical protein KP509_24G061000 [Ceratopteris richardii]|uniref:Secreted protein n=1 Tax=Ceratopteris richardii TaxID=49495 RepID=A0A8T2RVB6_CERRI|nr:hypothetical protein KP509_24G061000 [Ceratopteris richardii]